MSTGFLLDTNVLSELRKGRKAHPQFQAWMNDKLEENLFTSAICMMEIRIGIDRAMIRDADFGNLLREWYETKLKIVFAPKTLSVELATAERCAGIQKIRTLPYRDSLIAATAAQHTLTVASRNVRDFTGVGLNVTNPWEPSS